MGTIEPDLEEAGRTTTVESISGFYDLLRHMTLPSAVNIEGWSTSTLKALLDVCSSSGHSITLMKESKTIQIMRFPSTAEMLDSLAAYILRDEI